MPIKINGATSGYVDVSAPAVAGTSSFVLPTGTVDLSGSVSLSGGWTSWTPVLGNGWALGNGSAFGGYVKIGRTVTFWGGVTLGSTSTTASGTPSLTIPVTGLNDSMKMIRGEIFDASANDRRTIFTFPSGTTAVYVQLGGISAAYINASSTVPWTWTTSDTIEIFGTYEGAS